MFDAVIFDCDGVLVDSEALALEIELELMAAVGVTYDRPTFCRRFKGLHSTSFYAALDADARSWTGKSLPDDFARSHTARIRAAFDAALDTVPGAAEATAGCPRPIAVASSSPTDLLETKLGKVGLWDHFVPHVYSGDLVARGKPAPDLFLFAANRLGVDRRACLVIEDSVNGVVAGVAAGMTVWGSPVAATANLATRTN
jgi:HAD superfamily hydrolase (TIGR01509 family)